MSQKNENRRVRMTKRLMKDALLELLKKQELTNISVTAVCETADVHRSTFYNYYTDPADLLRDIQQDFLDRIPSPPQTLEQLNQTAIIDAASDFFDYVKDNKTTAQILFNSSCSGDFAEQLVNHLCNGYLPVWENPDELSARFLRLYIAHGAVGMLHEWISAGFPMSSREIAEMMYTLSKKISHSIL